MDEVLSNYQWFFGAVYAFIFAVLYETCADRVLSFIPKLKLEKWNESWRNALSRYSESDIKTNYRWLGIVQLSLIGIGGIFACIKFNAGILYVFVPMVIISFLLISEKAFDLLCKRLFVFDSWMVYIIMILTFGLMFYRHPECFLYGIDDNMIVKYATGAVISLVTLILILLAFFGLICAIIPSSKVFVRLLIKKEKVAEYCLTYIFIVSLTTLMSIGVNKFINYIWQTAYESFQDYSTSYFC